MSSNDSWKDSNLLSKIRYFIEKERDNFFHQILIDSLSKKEVVFYFDCWTSIKTLIIEQ